MNGSIRNKTLKVKPFQFLRNYIANTRSSVKNFFEKRKAKKEGRPFHATMKQKEIRERARRVDNNELFRKTRKQSQNRRNFICSELERLGATNMPKYRNTYKKYCLSNENVNVNQVNLERLVKEINSFSENTNLPLVPRSPPPRSKTPEELVEEEAEKKINLSKAVRYSENRAERVRRLKEQALAKNTEPLTEEELRNVFNFYTQRAPKKPKTPKQSPGFIQPRLLPYGGKARRSTKRRAHKH